MLKLLNLILLSKHIKHLNNSNKTARRLLVVKNKTENKTQNKIKIYKSVPRYWCYEPYPCLTYVLNPMKVTRLRKTVVTNSCRLNESKPGQTGFTVLIWSKARIAKIRLSFFFWAEGLIACERRLKTNTMTL